MESVRTVSEHDVITELPDATELPGGAMASAELPPLSPPRSPNSRPDHVATLHARLPDDVTGPLLYDVTVVGNAVIVTDSLNHKVKAFSATDGRCLTSLTLTHIPLCVAPINDDTLMVTLHQQRQLLVISVVPELRLLETIPTSKTYRGVAALRLPVTAEVIASSGIVGAQGGGDVTVVCVTAPGYVDLLSVQGAMLRSFRFESLSLPLRDPICLAVRPPCDVTDDWTAFNTDVTRGFPDSGNNASDESNDDVHTRHKTLHVPSLLVTDVDARSLFEIRLTGEGRALGDLHAEERPFDWPLGVACDVTGDTFVVDMGSHTLHLVSPGDVKPRVLLGRRDGLCFPRGVHVQDAMLYITQDQDVRVYRL